MLLGVIFLILGFKLYSLKKKIHKLEKTEGEDQHLVTKGVYKIVRHPDSLAWILIFIGSTLILDSAICLILIPILVILTQLDSFLREKYILIPKFGKIYENYKKKIPYRIIPPPYNYLFIIIAIFVIYIGFLNFIV
jgi:protein-S-isoprenylcysteine O-methyltransferase Ste14